MNQDDTQRLLDIKILIVDDDPHIREALDFGLQAEGALTQACSDGNMAVVICETDPPDLMILDMMLPRRSGFLVMEKIKELPEDQRPHVIMITANEGKRHQTYAAELGVNAYLQKPIRLEKLILTILEQFKPEAS